MRTEHKRTLQRAATVRHASRGHGDLQGPQAAQCKLHSLMLGMGAAALDMAVHAMSSHNVGEAVQDRLEDAVHIWQSQSPPRVWESFPIIDGLQAANLQHGGRRLKLACKQAPANPWSLQSLQVAPGSWQPPSVLHVVCYLVLMGLKQVLLRST